jgi:transcription elongation factor SPT4
MADHYDDLDGMDEDEHGGDDHAEPPLSLLHLRACMRCALIKTYGQFYDSGCENCSFLNMGSDKEQIESHTSANFKGLVL